MFRLVAAIAVLIGLLGPARAQATFPNRAVTIVVPYAAGGPSDVVTRILAGELQRVWNQPVVILNRGGAGTTIGTTLVARARPDGYTLGQTAGSFTINPSIRRNMPYDTLADFANVAIFLISPHAIVAHTGFAPSTMQELVAEAGRRTLTFASSGVGSSAHMTGELIQSTTGTRWEHVPYNGQAEAAADVMAGRIDFSVVTWSDARPSVDAGRLKLLAISYPNRLPDLPNMPTVIEAIPAMAALPVGAWTGITAPAGVPPEVLATLAEGIRTAIASEGFRQRVLALGSYPTFQGPAEADGFIRNEIAIWADVVRRQRIVVE
jgi:tripartite-type tricarboxylate transporter receptor subunit TctC